MDISKSKIDICFYYSNFSPFFDEGLGRGGIIVIHYTIKLFNEKNINLFTISLNHYYIIENIIIKLLLKEVPKQNIGIV